MKHQAGQKSACGGSNPVRNDNDRPSARRSSAWEESMRWFLRTHRRRLSSPPNRCVRRTRMCWASIGRRAECSLPARCRCGRARLAGEDPCHPYTGRIDDRPRGLSGGWHLSRRFARADPEYRKATGKCLTDSKRGHCSCPKCCKCRPCRRSPRLLWRRTDRRSDSLSPYSEQTYSVPSVLRPLR